jgi:hypothetical protein
MTKIGTHSRTVLRCVYQCLPQHLTPSGEGISIKTFQIRLRIATVLVCLGNFVGAFPVMLYPPDGFIHKYF